MEVVKVELTARQFNFLVDLLQDIASNRIAGDPTRVARSVSEQREADALADVLLQQRMGI